MGISETEDLLDKHIIHHDYFSYTLHNLKVKRADSVLPQPAAIADAFFNSIRSYKGRLFLMGKYEFVLGSLSNWADRLLDVMESGDYIRAIKLATGYYLGEEDFVSVGLPINDDERHSIVLKSLPDLLFASLGYTLQSDSTSDHPLSESVVIGLTDACITATIAMNEIDLLSDIFEIFEASPHRKVFFQELASFIYDGDIKSLPAKVFKELVLFYSSSSDVLEDLTCRLNTDTLDIDLVFSLCRRYHLRDTLTYITNCALRDFKSPLIEFITIIDKLQGGMIEDEDEFDQNTQEAEKVYPYLSYILTGRVYPTALLFSDETLSYYAKCATYYLLFSGKQSAEDGKFAVLNSLLHYNSSAFFAALNEGFEDTFLNGSDGIDGSGYPSEEISFGSLINRQLIINILLDVFYDDSNNLDSSKRIFLNIFIARNYPKYSQFILLPGKVLSKILNELCYYSDQLIKEECEVAVNSLLTKYKPPDLQGLITTLNEVKYYSILLYLFRSEQQYSQLLQVAFQSFEIQELESEQLLDVVEECLLNTRDMNQTKERGNIDRLISTNFELLVSLNSARLVEMVGKFCPHLHDLVFKLANDSLQHDYLKMLFQSDKHQTLRSLPSLRARTLYISLLAKRHERNEVYQLLNTILTHPEDVELPTIVDDLISSKCIDSLVLLLSRQERISEAMIYLLDHLLYLNDEYMAAVQNEELENEFTRYTSIGIDLCLEAERKGARTESESPGEAVWIRLIDTLIDILKDTICSDSEKEERIKAQKLFKHSLLRQALSSLLGSPTNISGIQHDTTIIRIFRSILVPESAKTRTVGSLRPLLDDLFSSYNYQHTMLCVVAEILDSDTYLSLLELVGERLKGWRVSKSGECEGCGRKVIGVGVDAEWLYYQWEKDQKNKIGSVKSVRRDKGKKRETSSTREQDDILVVFKCGHTYHWGCLKRLGIEEETKCIVCD